MSRVPRELSQLSIRLLISAQVMILRVVRLSPELGSVSWVWSMLEILSLSLCPSPCSAGGCSSSKKKKPQYHERLEDARVCVCVCVCVFVCVCVCEVLTCLCPRQGLVHSGAE